jgi:hypothetical protein
MHQHEIESLEFEKMRWPIAGSSAVLLGGAVIAAVLVVALGTYLMFADDPPKLGDGTHLDPPLASVQHEVESAAPAPMNFDVGEAPTEASVHEAIAAPAPESDSHSPRVVRTERFESDPTVWASVRKFTPLPPDQVPILDFAPVESPTAAPAVPDASSGVGALHHQSTRAPSHPRHRAHTHTRVKRSRTQADGGAPLDVGGTRMTAEQLRQDGTKSLVVSTFSTMLGPR